MIQYNGKSYVSDKMLSGECKGIYMKDVVSDVSGKTLAAQCQSVCLGDKYVYGVDYPTLADLLVDYPTLADLLVEYPTLADLLVEYPTLADLLVEDKDVVHSLVDTGYTRWLVNDGSSFINTGIPADKIFKISSDFVVNNSNYDTNYVVGVYNTNYGLDRLQFKMRFNKTCFTGWGQRYNLNVSVQYTPGARANMMIKEGLFYVNGNLVSDFTGENFKGGDAEMYIFALNADYDESQRQIAYMMQIKDVLVEGVDNYMFIPFTLGKNRTKNQCYPQVAQPAGTCGMIDLLTGTFYCNANTTGQFTIELTKNE